MKKTVEYVVRTTVNAITQETQTVPVVVNRREPVDLVDVVANCIDRNLILGAKPTAAQGIAEGIAEQLAVEFKKGNGVKFGKYFYGRLYLNGTTNQNGDLSEDNALNVRLYKGEDFKLSLDDFSFSFVNGGDLPDVEFCIGRGDGVRGELDAGNDLVIYGTNLYYEDDTAFAVKLTSDTGVVRTIDDDSLVKSADQVIVPGTAIPPLELTNGKWKVTVERTTADGKKLYGKGANILCVGFVPTPGPTPIVQTSDGKCKVMTFEDGEETVTFGVDWNMVGSGLYGSNAPSGEWSFDSAWVHVGAEDAYFQGTWNEDATEATMSPRQGESLTSGTYDNVLFHYTVVRDGITETLDIPIARMVVP